MSCSETSVGLTSCRFPSGPADLILRGGKVYTAGMSRSRWAAVAVSGGRIIYCGPEERVGEWSGPRTEVIDVRRGMILPGFWDAHVHPIMGGLAFLGCPLFDLDSKEAYLSVVHDYAAANPNQPFIRGRGWLQSVFPSSGPDKRSLDEAVPDRPVILKSLDAHSAWVNSKALELAGISADKADPPGGRIERVSGTGEPSGGLREWSAMALVEDRLPPPTQEDRKDGVRVFLELAAKMGVTGVHEAKASRDHLEAYRDLERNGELSLRVHAAVVCEPESGEDGVQEFLHMQRTYTHDLLRVRTAKCFLDGVVEAHTAYLLKPYADRPGFRGEPLWEREAWLRMAKALDGEGVQLHLHVIGDGAIRMALDGLEHAQQANGPRDGRHQVAHLDLVSPSDIDHLCSLGAVANLQPSWFYVDDVHQLCIAPFLGSERAGRLYPMRSLLDAGVIVTCGSDWPAGGDFVSCNPLDCIQIGMTRKGLTDEPAPVYLPAERVELRHLLDCFTIHAAYANFLEQETGSLEAGKSADLIVLDRDLFDIPAEEVSNARVLLTLFRGGTVFRDPSL